jgi:hypothetical protein
VSITETVLSAWFASYTVCVFGFAATPTGAAPTVVIRANLVQPLVLVALHLVVSKTQTSFRSWLDAYNVCVFGLMIMFVSGKNPVASVGAVCGQPDCVIALHVAAFNTEILAEKVFIT